MPYRLTLLADGPTDQALLPILRWLLTESGAPPFELVWADLRRLRRPPQRLLDRVSSALDLYPCELLVVHRDAEKEPPELRDQQIEEATCHLSIPVVRAVPVRMTEAWLLFDEMAIREASGCPNGKMPLELPALKKAESLPDPKEILHEAMRRASGLVGRRLKAFSPDIRRLADLIDDFSPLRTLPSFKAFEGSLKEGVRALRGAEVMP